MEFTQKLKDEIKAIGITAFYFGCWIAALLLLNLYTTCCPLCSETSVKVR